MKHGKVWVAITFVSILLLDQVTKHTAQQELVIGTSIPVIPELFNFTLVYNKGAAFGMFSGLPDPWRQIVLMSVSAIALIVVLVFLRNEAKGDTLASFALVLIVSGAIGNLIDRIRYDAVVDFLDFYWKDYHWPAFNIADSAICIGVAILLVRMIFHPKVEESSQS